MKPISMVILLIGIVATMAFYRSLSSTGGHVAERHDEANQQGKRSPRKKMEAGSHVSVQYAAIARKVINCVSSNGKEDAEVRQLMERLNLKENIEIGSEVVSSSAHVELKNEAIVNIFKWLASISSNDALDFISNLMKRYPSDGQIFPHRSVLLETCIEDPKILAQWILDHPAYIENSSKRAMFFEDLMYAAAGQSFDASLEVDAILDVPKIKSIQAVAKGVTSLDDKSKVIDAIEDVVLEEQRKGTSDQDLEDWRLRVVSDLGENFMHVPFEEAANWLQNAPLDEAQKSALLARANPTDDIEEQWDTWIGMHLNPISQAAIRKAWVDRHRPR